MRLLVGASILPRMLLGCDFNIADVTSVVTEKCHSLEGLNPNLAGTGQVTISINGSAVDDARLRCEVSEKTNAGGALSRWKSWLQVCGHYQPQLRQANWCVTQTTTAARDIAKASRQGAAEVHTMTIEGSVVTDSAWHTELPIGRGATLRLTIKIDGDYNTWGWSQILDARGTASPQTAVGFKAVQVYPDSRRVYLDLEVFDGPTRLWVYETENQDIKLVWHEKSGHLDSRANEAFMTFYADIAESPTPRLHRTRPVGIQLAECGVCPRPTVGKRSAQAGVAAELIARSAAQDFSLRPSRAAA